jgi:hypothetical protein
VKNDRADVSPSARGAFHCRRFKSSALSVAVLALAPLGAVLAEVVPTASATVQYQYNSNVFGLQSGSAVPGVGRGERGDSYYAYGATLGVDDLWGQQKVFFKITGTDFRYDRFSALTHTEYNIDGGLNWKLANQLDGSVEVARIRTMLAIIDLTPAAQFELQLPVQTEQRETAKIGYPFNDWRVEGEVYRRGVDEPLLATPDLHLNETFGQLALKYVGRAGLTSGLSAGYLSGDYSGSTAANNPSYKQKDFDLTANYQAKGRSSFAGQVGYSQRTSATGANDIGGITGQGEYRNQLTGKSSVDVVISRTINSYVANAGSEIDSVATVNLNWQATYLLGVSAGYSYSYRNFPNQGLGPNNPGNGPNDNGIYRQQYVSLNIVYEVLRWLTIKPYANVLTRTTDIPGGNFNATIYGIYFTVHNEK